MDKRRVIIDVDPAIGVPLRDIDDALAILLLLASPGISLEGVTVNFGNAPSVRGFAIAGEVLSKVGAGIPLFRGAASKHELGKPNPAVEFMTDTVNRHPGKVTLLAVAPLTNVATAMLLDPGFAEKLGGLVIMGGSLHFKPFCWLGEFNFQQDAAAALIALSTPVRRTIITMDVCAHALFKKKHLAMLRDHDSTVARYLAARIPSWLLVNRIFFRKGGFYPWDPVAAAYVIDDTLFDGNLCTFTLQTEGFRSGRILDFRMVDRRGDTGVPVPMNLPLRLDGDRFMRMLMDGLLSL